MPTLNLKAPNLDFTDHHPNRVPDHRIALLAGTALLEKVREQTATSGAYRAARNIRKQGFSLDVALALVAGRMP